MRKLLLALLLLLCLPVGLVHAQSQIWIYGQVTSDPVQATYIVPCLQFTFAVSDSQQTSLIGSQLTVVVPFSIGNETLNSYYNFSGYMGSGSGIPSGYFVVERVNTGSEGTPSWLAYFGLAWSYASMIGGFLVTYVTSIVTMSGYQIPNYMISLLLLGIVLLGMIFGARKLPWYFAVVMIFLGIAVASNLVSSLI